MVTFNLNHLKSRFISGDFDENTRFWFKSKNEEYEVYIKKEDNEIVVYRTKDEIKLESKDLNGVYSVQGGIDTDLRMKLLN